MKNKIQFLTMVGCHNCEAVKKIFDEIMPDFKNIEVTEIDIASPEGQELAGKYMVMASPGIVINDELFSTGGVDKGQLIAKLQSLESGDGNPVNAPEQAGTNTNESHDCCAVKKEDE